MQTRSSQHTRKLVQLSILLGVILLMSFTPLGYLKTASGIEITFLALPVAVGAVLLGWQAGAILGGVFGLTSFLQCVMGTSPLGVLLLQINPFLAFVVCVVPRVLIGVVSAFVFRGMCKLDRSKWAAYPIACMSASLTNAVGFLGLLILCFGGTDALAQMGFGEGVLYIVGIITATNGILETVVVTLVGGAVCKAVATAQDRLAPKPKQSSSNQIPPEA